MGRFFIKTDSGQVATHRQLLAAGLIADGDDAPTLPWHPIQGSPDATTLWHAVMRKKMSGVFIGTLVLRHGDHHASLLADGWEELAVADIAVAAIAAPVGETDESVSPAREARSAGTH